MAFDFYLIRSFTSSTTSHVEHNQKTASFKIYCNTFGTFLHLTFKSCFFFFCLKLIYLLLIYFLVYLHI